MAILGKNPRATGIVINADIAPHVSEENRDYGIVIASQVITRDPQTVDKEADLFEVIRTMYELGGDTSGHEEGKGSRHSNAGQHPSTTLGVIGWHPGTGRSIPRNRIRDFSGPNVNSMIPVIPPFLSMY